MNMNYLKLHKLANGAEQEAIMLEELEFIVNSASRIYILFILLYSHDSYLGETFVVGSTKNEVR